MAAFLCSFMAFTPAVRIPHVPHPSRSGVIVALSPAPLPETIEDTTEPEYAAWMRTAGGLKYQVTKLGRGAVPEPQNVVSLHYTISFSDSGDTLGTSRGRWPLAFALGKHEVPIFDDAVRGMPEGTTMRVVVPASRIPSIQTANVPKDQDGESLIVDIEILGVRSGLNAIIPSILPPGSRRVTIMQAVLLLSFVPYFLPEELKPAAYQWGDVEAIKEAHRVAYNSAWLGGASDLSLDTLFQ